MSTPFHLLLRVKELKEQQALRAMHAKRRQVDDAKAALGRARDCERASAATLSTREDRIYDGILSRVVTMEEIDDTKAQVTQLESEHNKIVDALERASQVHLRLEKELAEAAGTYRAAVKDKDKYVLLTDELAAERRSLLAHREEAEVEDLFGNRRRKSA